jgi:sigma-54 dependent transcriptional regulator, acetoin dehydrogenase operon transcriptional activator AcoR
MAELRDETLPRDDELAALGPPAKTAPELLLLFERDRPFAASVRYSLAGLSEVEIGRGATREVDLRATGMTRQLLIRIPDRRISAVHARLVRTEGTWLVEDTGSRNGVLVNGVLERRASLADGDVFELGHSFFSYRHAAPARTDEGRVLDMENTLNPDTGPPVASLPSFEQHLATLRKLAPSAVSVIIEGETGTGKELVGRIIHEMSNRSGPLVAVNCGALPGTLVESELFGYRKGAFSGAAEDRLGIIRTADRGTLFLDEIGDLPLLAQPALLRVLQENEVTAIGSTRAVPVDVRVIAATHRNLGECVDKGSFRADLYARLAGAVIRIPALRDRLEDVGIIVASLLRRLAPERFEAIGFSSSAARAILGYEWPRNVRELEKCLQTALHLAGANQVQIEHLPEAVQRADLSARRSRVAAVNVLAPEDRRRRDELVRLLAQYDNNISAVARHLGKGRTQVQRWMSRYRIRGSG